MRNKALMIVTNLFPRSEMNIKALGVFRSNSSNCKYAESFMLLKEIK